MDLDEGLLHLVKLFCYFFAFFFLFEDEHLIPQGFDSLLAFHQTHFDVFQLVVFLIDLSVKFVNFFQKRVYLKILFQKNGLHGGNLLIRNIQIPLGFFVVGRCFVLLVFVTDPRSWHMLFVVIGIDIIVLFW